MEFPIQFELPQIPSSCICFLHIFHATLVISVSLSIRFTLRDMLDKNPKTQKQNLHILHDLLVNYSIASFPTDAVTASGLMSSA
jgi:hypothetical protein